MKKPQLQAKKQAVKVRPHLLKKQPQVKNLQLRKHQELQLNQPNHNLNLKRPLLQKKLQAQMKIILYVFTWVVSLICQTPIVI
jgi:hypothetical protein